MSTIVENIQKIKQAKADLKSALADYGIDAGDSKLSTYATLIEQVYDKGESYILEGDFSGAITIPAGTTKIGDYTFYKKNEMTSVSIPGDLSSIGDYAFYGCTGLTSLEIPSTVEFGDYAFYGCSKLEAVDIDSILGLVDSNAEHLFEKCTSLKSFAIHNADVQKNYYLDLGNYMFNGCTSLTSVTIPNIPSFTGIGTFCFQYCTSLTSIDFPDGLCAIHTAAFRFCI